MAPCRERHPTPFRFEERRIHGLYGLKTTLFLVLTQSRAGASFWCLAGRFQTLKQRPRFYAGFVLFYDVHNYKENMFTINLEDGCEAPSKASFINFDQISWLLRYKDEKIRVISSVIQLGVYTKLPSL